MAPVDGPGGVRSASGAWVEQPVNVRANTPAAAITCLFTAPFCRTGTVHPLGPLVPHRTAIDRSAIYRGRLRTVRTNQRGRETPEQIATLRSVPSCRVQGLLHALFSDRRVRSITWSPWAMWWPCGQSRAPQ